MELPCDIPSSVILFVVYFCWCKVLQRQVSKFERLLQKNQKNSAERSGCSNQGHSGRYMYMYRHSSNSGNSGRYMYQEDTHFSQVHRPDRPDQDPDPDPDQDQDQNTKWVINLSDVPLTPMQEAVLAHGPSFAVTPKNPPIVEYITSLEVACQKLNTNTAEELRSEVYRALRHSPPPQAQPEEGRDQGTQTVEGKQEPDDFNSR